MQDVRQIAQALISEMGGYCDTTGVCRQALRLLANGHPVAVEEIAAALQIPHNNVVNVLRQFPDVQYDAEGRVTDKGLTLTPTPHRFLVNGHMLFTWCALDALMYPAILQHTARVESPCVATGTLVKLTITPTKVSQASPPDAVVSIVVPEHGDVCCNVREAFCNHVNFFWSPEVASTWLEKFQNGYILSINEAYQVGRTLATQLYQEADN